VFSPDTRRLHSALHIKSNIKTSLPSQRAQAVGHGALCGAGVCAWGAGVRLITAVCTPAPRPPNNPPPHLPPAALLSSTPHHRGVLSSFAYSATAATVGKMNHNQIDFGMRNWMVSPGVVKGSRDSPPSPHCGQLRCPPLKPALAHTNISKPPTAPADPLERHPAGLLRRAANSRRGEPALQRPGRVRTAHLADDARGLHPIPRCVPPARPQAAQAAAGHRRRRRVVAAGAVHPDHRGGDWAVHAAHDAVRDDVL